MNVYILAILAAGAAVAWEWLVRSHPSIEFWRLWLLASPGQLLIAYTVYRLVLSDGIIGATVIFTGATNLLRLVVVLAILRESVSTGAWVAFGMLLVANLIKFVWR
jgi:hypothetical protein